MNIRVTVLQCCSSKTTTTKKSKTNSISIYINIEVFFGMGGSILRTATLQRCNSECRVGACFSSAERLKPRRSQRCKQRFSHKKFFEKKSKTFVNRNENVVTLQTEIKKDPLNLPAQGDFHHPKAFPYAGERERVFRYNSVIIPL